MKLKALLIAGSVSFVLGIILMLMNFIPFISCCCCLALPLLFPLAGIFYGVLARMEGNLTPGSGLLGGAICGGLAGLGPGLIYAIVALVMGSQGVIDTYNQMNIQLPPDFYTILQSPLIMVLTALILLLGTLLFSSVLGAIGGIIFGAAAAKRPVPQKV